MEKAKVDMLELMVIALNEHEKRLDAVVARLERVAKRLEGENK